jgi:hypothetical protein
MDSDSKRRELTQLIQEQIDAVENQIFGGATDAEHLEYEQRQKRIDELYDELYRLNAAA